MRLTALAILLVLATGACSSVNRLTAPAIDLSDYPPEMPPRIVSDLNRDAQDNLRRGLAVVDRELSDVCSPRELALIRESLIVFGWITSASRPDLTVQTYVNTRAPVLRQERENLNPACGERLDALIERIRDTRG